MYKYSTYIYVYTCIYIYINIHITCVAFQYLFHCTVVLFCVIQAKSNVIVNELH